MRLNARKSKPNPANNQRHSIRSNSIRDIIGDRRFNHQFSHENTHGTQVKKWEKRTKAGEAEVHDLPTLERNASSIPCEATEEPRCCHGDFAAKTSEYAFFKRTKKNTCSIVHPHYLDSQPNNVQQSDHFTREEVATVQKECVKCTGSSLPIGEERNNTHYTFLSPPHCGSKTSVVNNIFGPEATNAQYVKPTEYNWLSPSAGSKPKNSENEEVFSAKREKLRHLAASKSLYDVNDISSEGFDIVSALISRILPVTQKENSRETHSKGAELHSLAKSHESYKRKLKESRHVSYLDDSFHFPRSTRRPTDTDLLEWNPTSSESPFAPKSSIKYNHCPTKACNRKPRESCCISYLDDNDDFLISTGRPIDTDLPEQNPTGLESCIEYNHSHTEGGFRIPNLGMESFVSFDEPLSRYASNNFNKLVESSFHNEPKLLEPPRTLLLGWENNSEKDEPLLTSRVDDYQLLMLNNTSTSSPPSSPYINRHQRKEHFLNSPYTPKHLMSVEDCRINLPLQEYNTWCMNKSLTEKQHHDSQSFLFLIQSPANNFLHVLNTGLHSFVVDDENKENPLYSSDQLLEGRVKDYSNMEPFHDKHFDYPLLLHDSSWNDEL